MGATTAAGLPVTEATSIDSGKLLLYVVLPESGLLSQCHRFLLFLLMARSLLPEVLLATLVLLIMSLLSLGSSVALFISIDLRLHLPLLLGHLFRLRRLPCHRLPLATSASTRQRVGATM